MRNMSPLPTTPSGVNEHRRRGRVNCEALRTELGSVLDLSGSGMRVLCKGRCRARVADVIEVTLRSPVQTLPAKVCVRWVRKTGWRKHEIGLEFIDATPEFAASLGVVSRCCMKMQSIAQMAAK